MTNARQAPQEGNLDPSWGQPRRTPGSNTESVIDANSNFNGTYRTSQDLRIQGQYQGEIECEGTVTVDQQATVNAKIRAENVTVAGIFEGEVDCGNKFELAPTGKVSGTVTANLVAVHEGARFDGQLTRATAHSQDQHLTGAQEEPEAEGESESVNTEPPLIGNRRREAS